MLVNDLKFDLGVYVECIEVGNGYMNSVFEYACESIKSNSNFKGKFSVLGISQGTLIGIYIVTNCQMQG